MPILVARHGLSEANNRNNVGTLAFASKEAPLMERGRDQAEGLGQRLTREYGISVAETPVATSQLTRTQETAHVAGFNILSTYASLNEVVHNMELLALREVLCKRQLPPAAIEVAQAIIDNPPTEHIWITHGLVIAGLCQVLDVARDARFIPRFCEIRELPIG